MKHINFRQYTLIGLKFTSMIISPVILCIIIGLVGQKKFGLSQWFMTVCIFTAVICVIVNLMIFVKSALQIPDKHSHNGRGNNENNNSDKK